MILFAISFILVLISSYFIVSILKPKTNHIGLTYFALIIFSQVILTFEILSLFSAITQQMFLWFNFAFLVISIMIWLKNGSPIWIYKQNNLKHLIINSLKLDKSLMVLFVGFCIFIVTAIFLCITMPVNNLDALSYHIARCSFWLAQGNLNHFITADIRNTILPINSELLYSWVLLFAKKDIGIGFFGFLGYALSMINVFVILGLLKYSIRKRLWVIFILTALPSVLVQASTTETDVIIAWLITSSFILFWNAIKNDAKIPLFMSSLAFAIAIGVKPTAIMMIPAVGIFFLILSAQHKNYKKLLIFLGFGCVNFIIFSSYNYILNYLDFSNVMGLQSFIVINKNYYGLKGAATNFIKHLFMFINFTGFKWGIYLEPELTGLQAKTLALLHLPNIPDSYYTTNIKTAFKLFEPTMAAGVLGFLVYMPCAIIASVKLNPKKNKSLFLGLFGLLFFVNLFVISYLMNYSAFNCRYLVAFIIFSSPILVYSYGIKFKPLKNLIILFALFSLILISTHIKSRPFFKIVQIINKTHSLEMVRELTLCQKDPYCMVAKKIKMDFRPENKILVFSDNTEHGFIMKNLEFDGYDMDFQLLENARNIDFSKYNLIVITNDKMTSYYTKYTKPLKGIDCISYNLGIGFNKSPIFTKCEMQKDFLHSKNFVKSFHIETVKENKTDFYNVYKNLNNPPLESRKN